MLDFKFKFFFPFATSDFCFRKVNIVDSMVEKLEKYASNLEDIVQNRIEELLAEKKKADSLLYRLLPKSVHIYFIAAI